MPLCISSAGRTGRGMASAGAARRRHNDGTGVLPAPRRNLRASRVDETIAQTRTARARDGARPRTRYALEAPGMHRTVSGAGN